MLTRWYQAKIVDKINSNPNALFTVDADAFAGVWYIVPKIPIIGIETVCGTPFYEGCRGIPFYAADQDDRMIYEYLINFSCCGDPAEDAADYVNGINLALLDAASQAYDDSKCPCCQRVPVKDSEACAECTLAALGTREDR